MTTVALPPVSGPLLGWCAARHHAGGVVPAVRSGVRVCLAPLRLLSARPAPAGQLAFGFEAAGVPPVLRTPYPTGEQAWCAVCVGAGGAGPPLGGVGGARGAV